MTGAPCAVPTDNIFWCHLFLGGAVLHLPHRLNTPRELGPAQPEDSQCESKNQVIVSTLACIERRISGIAAPHPAALRPPPLRPPPPPRRRPAPPPAPRARRGRGGRRAPPRGAPSRAPAGRPPRPPPPRASSAAAPPVNPPLVGAEAAE